MSAEIKAKTGIEPELVAGGGGVFDIEADGRLLFSKHEAGRFPESGEAAALFDPGAASRE